MSWTSPTGPGRSGCSRSGACRSCRCPPPTSSSAIDTGPDQALVAPLARKHDQFVQQLDDARTRLAKAAGVSAVTATILQGPQTYLVLAGNNAEMRAGSGAYLEVGTAATSDGSVHLGRPRPSRASLALAPGSGGGRPATSSATGAGSSRGSTGATSGSPRSST